MKTAIFVSPEDEHLLQNDWRLDGEGYLRRSLTIDGKPGYEFLHRVICKPGPGKVVDHINGNKLDNRRENLRACTNTENLRNRAMHKNNKAGVKGVFARGSKFRAQIRSDGKRYHLGTFDTPEAAGAAYAAAATRLHGEFARPK